MGTAHRASRTNHCPASPAALRRTRARTRIRPALTGATAALGAGAAVMFGGESGVGKSRLLDECTRIDPSVPGVSASVAAMRMVRQVGDQLQADRRAAELRAITDRARADGRRVVFAGGEAETDPSSGRRRAPCKRR